MANDSPASIIFSSDGYEATVKDATTLVLGTPALLAAGSDGTNTRYISLDNSGRQIVVGAGTAGTPVGGVVTVQGGVGGQAVPVSGTVTSNIGTTGGLALDTTLAKLTVAQSTALGSNTLAMVGGSVTTAAPTYTTGNINPLSLTTSGLLRVDASGTTQTISGTITANIGTTNGLALDATLAKLTVTPGTALGSNTAAMVAGSVTTAAPTYTTGQINNLSLTTAGSLRVDGSGSTQPVSGTVTANIGTTNGLALDATLAKLTVAQSAALGSNTQALMGGSVTTAAPTYTTGNINPLSLTTGGLLRVDGTGGTFPISGSVTTSTTKSATSTLTNVASSASSVTVLASNANRLGATVYNDSTKKLYLKLGTAASNTSFTAVLFGQGYYEVPFNYTGVITGIWDAANGSARVDELTA